MQIIWPNDLKVADQIDKISTDRTWQWWLPQYWLCNGSSAVQVVSKFMQIYLAFDLELTNQFDKVKPSFEKSLILQGLIGHLKVNKVKWFAFWRDATWTADEPLHNQYCGSHHCQVWSPSFEKFWILQGFIGHLEVIRSNNLHNLETSWTADVSVT